MSRKKPSKFKIPSTSLQTIYQSSASSTLSLASTPSSFASTSSKTTSNPLMTNHFLTLRVHANAKTNRITRFNSIFDQPQMNLYIKAPPVDGKANKAIIQYLSSIWKIPKSNLEIKSGITSKNKVLSISNISKEQFDQLLSSCEEDDA